MEFRMGLLRVILALSVMTGHFIISYPASSVASFFPYLHGGGAIDGAIKVNAFFVIAGFYSQLLLEGRFYEKSGYIWKFYLYRALRLLPIYYLLVLANGLVIWCVSPHIYQRLWFVIAYNLNSWGDWVAHIFLWNPRIFYLPDAQYNVRESFRLVHAFVNPQLWALSNEIIFMALAPFICRGSGRLWCATIISAAAAYYFYRYGWVRNYLGATAIYFVLGCLAYKFYQKYMAHRHRSIHHIIAGYVTIALLTAYIIFFGHVKAILGAYTAYFIFMALVVVCVPCLAFATANLKWDRWIGETAYTIYLWHYIVFLAVDSLFGGRYFAALALCMIVGILFMPLLSYTRISANRLIKEMA